MRLSKILGFADTDIGKLGKVFLGETTTIKEIKERVVKMFAQKDSYEGLHEEFLKVKECLQKAPFFNDFEELKKYISKQTNLEDDNLLKPLRYILTAADNGPNISDIYPLIKNYLGEIVK